LVGVRTDGSPRPRGESRVVALEGILSNTDGGPSQKLSRWGRKSQAKNGKGLLGKKKSYHGSRAEEAWRTAEGWVAGGARVSEGRPEREQGVCP